jgi:type II secretory pathway pseudopilin PulG
MLTRRFSLIELAMVMLIITIVVYAMFSRILRYFEVAEKAAMTITVLEVERGMRVRLALAAMGGTSASVEKLQNINPFEFARALPPNYLGELGGAAAVGELKRGNWFYDRDRHEIGYLPRLASRLRTPDGKEVPVLRFRVETGGSLYALPHLVSVFAYHWEPEFGTF